MKEISIVELEKMNPFTKISDELALLTAGNESSFNTMTIGWATFGYIWRKPIATVYVRPQRYTYKFSEESEYMTIAFFDDKFKKMLDFCGTKSGKDVDKVKECNLHPVNLNGAVGFEEASLVIVGKKVYCDDIKMDKFKDQNIVTSCYPNHDFHKWYALEVLHIYVK